MHRLTNKKNKIVLLLLIFSIPLFSVEIAGENLTFDFLESSGYFKLFWTGNEYTESLLTEESPESTNFSVYEDDELYILGGSSHFKKTFNPGENGGTFIWRSKKLIVRQELSFLSPDSVTMVFSISNASETPVNTGLKILLDTVFEGENRFLFSEDEIQNYVNSEYEVESSKSFDYCISGLIDRDRKKALMVLVQNTSPDKIVAANWSRLNEADFQYRANIGRSFTNAPYSKNDSAIMFLYFPRNLLPGNTLAVSLILRAVDTADSQDSVSINLKDESPESTETQTISTPVNEGEPSEASETLQQNQRGGKKTFLVQSLVKIKQIRDIIDSLSNPGMLTDSTLDYLEKLMEELEKLNADESAE